MRKFVSYKRVSSKEQSKSGLGLEAQERDIQLFLENYAETPCEVVGEFVEVHSGADDDRPELNAAIALAKKENAVLVVSKLDRLSRRVSFLASLMEEKGLDFKVAQMPCRQVPTVIYALAEQERQFISQRASALAAAKARGVRLGATKNTVAAMVKARQE